MGNAMKKKSEITVYAAGQGVYSIVIGGVEWGKISNKDNRGQWYAYPINDIGNQLDVSSVLHRGDELEQALSKHFGL